MNKANDMQTKKVFSPTKYLAVMMKNMRRVEIQDIIVPAINPKGWVWVCDGKTAQECRDMGYGVVDDWCIEIPQNENIDFATMATCKDCLHYEACMNYTNLKDSAFAQNFNKSDVICDIYKNKSEWVHLPCKKGDVLERNGEFCEVDHWNVIATTFSEGGKLRLFNVEEAEKALEERRKEDAEI